MLESISSAADLFLGSRGIEKSGRMRTAYSDAGRFLASFAEVSILSNVVENFHAMYVHSSLSDEMTRDAYRYLPHQYFITIMVMISVLAFALIMAVLGWAVETVSIRCLGASPLKALLGYQLISSDDDSIATRQIAKRSAIKYGAVFVSKLSFGLSLTAQHGVMSYLMLFVFLSSLAAYPAWLIGWRDSSTAWDRIVGTRYIDKRFGLSIVVLTRIVAILVLMMLVQKVLAPASH